MLAVKSQESRMTFALVVERKGLVDYKTRRLVADLDWSGTAQMSVQVRSGTIDSRSQACCPKINAHG